MHICYKPASLSLFSFLLFFVLSELMKSLGIVSVSLWERKRRKGDFKNFLKVQVILIYNIVLVSGAQQNDPVMHIFFFQFLRKGKFSSTLIPQRFMDNLWSVCTVIGLEIS